MKTIAFSDLHGNYKLWKTIKNYYGDNDTLIFLGDACDRGQDSIKIMLEMLKDKRIIYLKGNHENMFLEYIQNGVSSSLKEYKEIIRYNGSKKTLEDYIKLSADDKIFLIDNLKKIKNYYIYINNEKKNIFLSHAGMDINNINNIDETKLLWDRNHMKNNIYDNRYDNWYIIHGHTPVQTVRADQLAEVYKYNNEHKIDIDMRSFVSNITATIDLDTFEIKYFKIDGENNDNN